MIIPQEREYDEICRLMERHKVPGASFALVQNGVIAHSGVLGESHGSPIRHDTRFEAASLTKPLFAYFVLLLCQRKIVDLDTPICKYLPNERASASDLYKQITPRHVLCHGCGFPNWSDEKPLPQLFSPGEGFEYSGEGYHYLQRAVENIFVRPLDELMQDHVLPPLGMAHSALIRTEEIAAHLSYSYDKNGAIEQFPKWGYRPNAAYSLYTTAEDYARFLCALMDDSAPLTAEYKGLMFAPQNKVNDAVLWGLGLGIASLEPRVLWHWGDNDGFKSFMCFCPQERWGYIMLSNGFGGTPLCIETAQALTSVDFSHVAAFVATTV